MFVFWTTVVRALMRAAITARGAVFARCGMGSSAQCVAWNGGVSEMKAITMTVYMMVDDDENLRKWNVSEWLDDPGVVGWEFDDGHPVGCPGCVSGHEESE